MVHILISTHPFGSILGSDESPHPTLALNPLFVTIGPLVIKILSVFVVLGEDNILVHILISTHLFGSNLGSEESSHYMPSLNFLFMMIGPLVIKIMSVCVVLGGGQHFGM